MSGTTYRDAGVDIDAAERMIDLIKPSVDSTQRPEQIGGIGGFSGLFRVPSKYREPVLSAGTDGVGTKLLVAIAAKRHRTVGIDLVAMCVNDVLVCGAEPLFFLDYYATGHLGPEEGAEVVSGIAEGCRRAGCALLGGETAELPGLYRTGEYDLAGMAVGVVERSEIIDGSLVRPGDALLGIASTGLHSNGYSLTRKVLLEKAGLRLDAKIPELGRTLADELLEPTAIYVKPVLSLMKKVRVKAMAHITGGGFVDNIPRTLPDGLGVSIRRGSWPVPPVFGLIEKLGQVSSVEMNRTFNLGIGMTLVVSQSELDEALGHLTAQGLRSWPIGKVIETGASPERVRPE